MLLLHPGDGPGERRRSNARDVPGRGGGRRHGSDGADAGRRAPGHELPRRVDEPAIRHLDEDLGGRADAVGQGELLARARRQRGEVRAEAGSDPGMGTCQERAVDHRGRRDAQRPRPRGRGHGPRPDLRRLGVRPQEAHGRRAHPDGRAGLRPGDRRDRGRAGGSRGDRAGADRASGGGARRRAGRRARRRRRARGRRRGRGRRGGRRVVDRVDGGDRVDGIDGIDGGRASDARKEELVRSA